MSRAAKKIFIFPDIHWSERDEQALQTAIQAHTLFKPHITIFLGDLLNCNRFSRHPKSRICEDSKYDFLTSELNPVKKFLTAIQANTKEHTYLLEGNHDAWFERWIANNPNVGKAFRSLIPSESLTKDRDNFTYIPYSSTNSQSCCLKLEPGLLFAHGWNCTKYSAQRHLEQASPHSIIFGHTHRADKRRNTTFEGKKVESMSVGCLCQTVPIYAHSGVPTDWVHGVGVVYLGRHSFTMFDVPIVKGSCVMPNGKEVQL